MAQAQAAYLPRGLVTRRAALTMLAMAIVLAVIAAFAANAYIAGEASKVVAPSRTVFVAAHDVDAGSFVGAADLTSAQIPLSDDLAKFYVAPQGAPAGAQAGTPAVGVGLSGIAAKALRKGEPILVGDVVPAETAGTVAPLIPLTIKVGDQQQSVVGGLNVPTGRFALPPAPVRANDHIDIWTSFITSTGASSTELVIGDAQIIEIVGTAAEPSGYVLALTETQLDRFLFYNDSGGAMVVTVRSSQHP
jgi:Flp pilus assembly protein CpaB